MKFTVIGAVAFLATALVTVPVDAQPQRQRMARPGAPADSAQPRRMQPQRMQRDGHPAGALLRFRDQLQLTDAQVQQLEALRQKPLPQVSQSDMMRAQADLLDATRGDGNPDAARAALDRMNRLRVDQQVAHLRMRKEAREVLTAEQKTRLAQVERRVETARRDGIGHRGMRPGAPGRGLVPAPHRRGTPGMGQPGFGPRGRSMMAPRRMGPPAVRPMPPVPPARRHGA